VKEWIEAVGESPELARAAVRATMTCRELVEFLADYLNGDLPSETCRAFEDHLAHCPSCVVYLNTYRETAVLAKAALEGAEATLPDDVPEDLVQAILAARRR
jgi:predicted anti-sigma-YlaC factor YlaD